MIDIDIKKITNRILLLVKLILIYLLCVLMMCIFFIFLGQNFRIIKDNYNTIMNIKVDLPNIAHKEFIFIDGNKFQNINYFGKSERLKSQVKYYANIIFKINTQPQNKLKKNILSESMGTFLLGPPGTGKTLYVKKFCSELDKELKCMQKFYTKTKNLCNYKINKLNEKDINELNNIPSCIRYISISSSDLKSTLETEVQSEIKNLFEKLKENCKPFTATIIFFDEAEQLFSNRNNITNNISATQKMMSEFMIQFNNMKNQIMPIIFFASTNIQSSIDRAILRRFSNKEHFNNPSKEEIFQFINHLFLQLKIYFINKNCLDDLTNMLKGYSLSSIESLINKFLIIDFNGNVKGFDFNNAKHYLKIKTQYDNTIKTISNCLFQRKDEKLIK